MRPDLAASAHAYLAAIERGATSEELAAFFTPDVVQREFPNRLIPSGATRDLAAILDGAARGKQILEAQHFEVLNTVVRGSSVALEVAWRATFRVTIGTLQPGTEMRARFAVFLKYRSGRIAEQHNYDCFEPW
jgi:ketosteroid isomerase-like protein